MDQGVMDQALALMTIGHDKGHDARLVMQHVVADFLFSCAGEHPTDQKNQDRRCPECGTRMGFQQDFNEDGIETQRPWWECENCGYKE